MFIRMVRLLSTLCLLGHFCSVLAWEEDSTETLTNVLVLSNDWQVSELDQTVEYLIDVNKRTFTDARKFCNQHGGHIVKINNSTIKAYIGLKYQTHHGPDYIWLNALQTSQNSGIFKWLDDNSTLTDIYSYAGSDTNSDCVAVFMFWSEDGLYYEWCSGLNAVICEKRQIVGGLNNETSTPDKSTQPPTNFNTLSNGIPTSWQVSEVDPTVEYRFDETERTFNEALVLCGLDGGRIVKITNATVQNYIHRKYLKHIGIRWTWLSALQTGKNSGIFEWLDDYSTVTNIDWDLQYSEPDNLLNDCVALALSSVTNLWWDGPCTFVRAVVCEKCTHTRLNNTVPSESLDEFFNHPSTNFTSQSDTRQQVIKQNMMMYLIITSSTALISTVLFGIYIVTSKIRKNAERGLDQSELHAMQ